MDKEVDTLCSPLCCLLENWKIRKLEPTSMFMNDIRLSDRVFNQLNSIELKMKELGLHGS